MASPIPVLRPQIARPSLLEPNTPALPAVSAFPHTPLPSELLVSPYTPVGPMPLTPMLLGTVVVAFRKVVVTEPAVSAPFTSTGPTNRPANPVPVRSPKIAEPVPVLRPQMAAEFAFWPNTPALLAPEPPSP